MRQFGRKSLPEGAREAGVRVFGVSYRDYGTCRVVKGSNHCYVLSCLTACILNDAVYPVNTVVI